MINELKIEGFKSLHSLKLDLGRINCFIGANGAGKSNILEALGVLSAAASGTVDDESLMRRGVRPGLPRLYKSSFSSSRTPAHIGLSAISDQSASYRISLLNPLEKPEPLWSYKTEVLADDVSEIISSGVRKKVDLDPTAGLAALKMIELARDNPARMMMEKLQQFAIYAPNTPTLRSLVPDTQPRSPVGLSGGLVSEGFAELKKTVLDKDESLANDIYDLIDWISDITTTSQTGSLLSPSVGRTTESIKFTDRFMQTSRNQLTAYDASEGVLYILFCALLCLSPKAPSCFAVDNIDMALNPRLASALIQKMSKWILSQARQQILFTSHNPAVLDGLDLANPQVRLFAVERNAFGHTVVRRVELTESMKKLNEQYPLSRLWLMGNLGALPHV
ncbi:AAA family ATPase [Kalamiella sp. sgz302252]|uniref:AAA family ATPase n=1 Tax=Pantoea sp. sgz302252 TaxID=3341827 RepID=UPI0036D35CCF